MHCEDASGLQDENQSSNDVNSIIEMEDMTSHTQLIDESFAYENDLLSTSLPSILGASLRAAYLKRASSADSPDRLQCRVHPAIEATHFCRDCDYRLCSPCIALDHNEHDVISRESAIENKFDNLAGNIAQFSEMLESLEKVIEKTKRLKQSVLEEKSRVQGEIESSFAALHRQLDELKGTVMTDLDKTCDKYVGQCEERIAGWTQRRQDLGPLESLEDDTKQKLREGTKDLFEMEVEVRSQLIEAKALLPSLLVPNSMRLSVRWNDKFRNAFSEKSLGGPPATIFDEEFSLEPFKKMLEFSSRHINDKVGSCIEALTLVKNKDGDEMLALVDSANCKIKMFTPRGRPVRCFVGGGRYRLHHPTDIETVRDGNCLAVCDPGGNKVVVFSERGVGQDHFGVGSCEALTCLPGVDVAPSLAILNAEASRLEVVEVAGDESTKLRKRQEDLSLQHEGLLSRGRYLAVNHLNGCIFIADPYEHCLLVFSPEGSFMKKYGRLGGGFGELNTPASVISDRKGRMLVADFFNHRVHLLDPCANFIRFALTAANGIRHPRALRLEPDDSHLWVVQRDGFVMQFAYS